MYRVGILTISDKGSRGEREDLSGPEIKRIIEENGYETAFMHIVPDEKEEIMREMIEACDKNLCDLFLTTGGTGFAERDVTPEATAEVGEKLVPGIPEAMRAYSMTVTPRGMLSRGTCVIRKKTLILNLPGSVKSVRENLEYVIGSLGHGLDILTGNDAECGSPHKH
ncbi:MAG: MogA/MoaB family molybdenum cofactor biosynthesis protein [Eubacterium sp.]|nr:MogA/MoaB family molybdenum cofactor biosynthesis protein [Eubacterium sp.]